MDSHKKNLQFISDKPFSILNYAISKYASIDLSINNAEIKNLPINDPAKCQNYIETVLDKNNALVAYGGYLEKRNLYTENPNFSSVGKSIRNIHLGTDFWAKADVEVRAPVDGAVHSFKNNAVKGDYGPTIVLRHEVNGFLFHTLYGHLSLASLEKLYCGKQLKRGEVIGTLGDTAINVNYAPHLHFQLIIDMENIEGDYPGVCAEEDLEFYSENCPNPNLLLKI